MKNTWLVVLALATALATVPAAKADTITFNAIGNGISTAQTITLDAVPVSTGVYNIASISGTFSDPGVGIVNGTITGLYADHGGTSLTCWDGACGQSYLSLDGLWDYDNLVYLPGNPLLFDGFAGELFYVNSGGNTYEVNIAGLPGGYQVWATNVDGNYIIDGTGGVPLTATPEPASLLLLGTGLLFLSGFAFRKTATHQV